MSVEPSQVRAGVVTLLLIAAMTAVYYLLPVPGGVAKGAWQLAFWCGIAVLGSLILVAIRRLLRAGEAARLRGLILLLCLTVLFFSYADRTLAVLAGQFAGLQTKTDALYFNVSTMATVGFGDVHASGQLARQAVTLQIVFNLVFLGTAVGVISGLVRTRANNRAQSAGPRPARPAPPEASDGTRPARWQQPPHRS
jgi:voltage-gated potassium channel